MGKQFISGLGHRAMLAIYSAKSTSPSMLAVRLKIPFSEATQLLEYLEKLGILRSTGDAKLLRRKILLSKETYLSKFEVCESGLEESPLGGERHNSRESSQAPILAKKPVTPVTTYKQKSFLEKVSGIGMAQNKHVKTVPQKESTGEVRRLMLDLKFDSEIINETERVTTFLKVYDEILQTLQKLVDMGAAPPEMAEPPAHALSRLQDNFQHHLKFAIERAKSYSIQIICEDRALPRDIEAECFARSIREVSVRFSGETKQFASEAIKEVFLVAGLVPPKDPINEEKVIVEKMPVEAELERADSMDGHTFEHWCAELLKKNGFTNVEVTRGSGDQGVDVLAVKDGIKYAIQCKCYSSDLGNKPVQEVNTGKIIYHCHVGVVITNRHFTQGAKEAAEATGVLLWDRDHLRRMIDYANYKAIV